MDLAMSRAHRNTLLVRAYAQAVQCISCSRVDRIEELAAFHIPDLRMRISTNAYRRC